MERYTFSELSPEAQHVAVNEYLYDAKVFKWYEEDEDYSFDEVFESIKNNKRYRFDKNGVLIGSIINGEFRESGMY